MAIIGGAPLAHTNGLFTALAVNALNALLGSVDAAGRRVVHAAGRRRGRRPRAQSLDKFAATSLAGRHAGEGAAPRRRESGVRVAAGVEGAEALEKVPFIVSFGSFLDETSVLADLILPDHSFLESWADARARVGLDRRRRERAPARR